MESNGKMLPSSTSAVTVEVSLNQRHKDIPTDSISAIQVKHDSTVSMKLPIPNQPRYRSEAFVVLSPTSPGAPGKKFVNAKGSIPGNTTGGSRPETEPASQIPRFRTGAVKSHGEVCDQCASYRSKKSQCQGFALKNSSCGSEDKTLRKQKAVGRDTVRHCSPLRRQCRVGFDNQSTLENQPAGTAESHAEPNVSSVQQIEPDDQRESPSDQKWNPIQELEKFIEEEKEQQNLPCADTTKEPCEQLETSTDSIESGSEVNPLWVLDSITASVDKCNSPGFDTILEEAMDSEIEVDCQSDGKTQSGSSVPSGDEGVDTIAGASADERSTLHDLDEEDKRLSRGSEGSFGFEPHFEEDFSGYVEGKEYFKNLPTFHRLLTSAEKDDLVDDQNQDVELAALRLEDQIPGLHEQSDYAQDMMDTHAMRSEYWDYPYPSRSDEFDTAMGTEDRTELLQNMRKKIRGRLRQPRNSSNDSGCQDTDVNHSSMDDSEALNRVPSSQGQCQDLDGDGTQSDASAHSQFENATEESTKSAEEEMVEGHSSSNRRQVLADLEKLITLQEGTDHSLPHAGDIQLKYDTPKDCDQSRLVDGPTTASRPPMEHKQLEFVHYENITIVKKRNSSEKSMVTETEGNNDLYSNKDSHKSDEKEHRGESLKSEKDRGVAYTGSEESIAEPIDIDLSDPDVLEATKRMQLAFRKRKGPRGSTKFRSLQIMRAKSDSASDRVLGDELSLSKKNPFPGHVSMETSDAPIPKHHSLPPNFIDSFSEHNTTCENSFPTRSKNIKERMCKKLSRQNSVSQFHPFSTSLTSTLDQNAAHCELSKQGAHQKDEKEDQYKLKNESDITSQVKRAKEMSNESSSSCSLSNLKMEAENKEPLEGLSTIEIQSSEEIVNEKSISKQDEASDSLAEPDVDLKDPKVQDASKKIQQAFRRKKLLSKKSRGSVEEKACKKVKSVSVANGHQASKPKTRFCGEIINAHTTDESACATLYADTTVNVVIEESDLHEPTKPSEPLDRTEIKLTENKLLVNEASSAMKSSMNDSLTFKGVMIIDEKPPNYLADNDVPPSPDGTKIIEADANANFQFSFENRKMTKRVSSISEATLGDDIDIDLLDAEVKAVTEKLQSVSIFENNPLDIKILESASNSELNEQIRQYKLEEQNVGERASPNDCNASNEPKKETSVENNVTVKSQENRDVDIDLKDPDVQKTAFKLQSAFWKKKNFGKNKSPTTSHKDANSAKPGGSKHSSSSDDAMTKNIKECLTRKGNESNTRNWISHGNEDNVCKINSPPASQISGTNESLKSSRKSEKHEQTIYPTTNNESTRPKSSKTNTINLVSTSKQTQEIDIDLTDSKVKEATKKIQSIFKRKRDPKKTTEDAGKDEKKPHKSNSTSPISSKRPTKPMILTSFLSRSGNVKKETKASKLSSDHHSNTDEDAGMKRSTDTCVGSELEKTNDPGKEDNRISNPRGKSDDKHILNISGGSPLTNSDEDICSNNHSALEERTSPNLQRDDDRRVIPDDVNEFLHSDTFGTSADEGAKSDKFNYDNIINRSSSFKHYADVEPMSMPPASSTASLLRMQDEVDVESLLTTLPKIRETHEHVISTVSVSCSLTSMTTAPSRGQGRDRDGDVDVRLKTTPTTSSVGKSVQVYLDQTSDDTEYETAHSDFSDRLDDELERTLVEDDVTPTESQQLESAIHHGSPRFLIRPKNASCYHGDSARFVCCITGSPRPDISWFASGNVVRPERDNRLQITDYHENDGDWNEGINACALVSILDILEVTFFDECEYACVAINSQGQAFSSAHLKIETHDPATATETRNEADDVLSDNHKKAVLFNTDIDKESHEQGSASSFPSTLPRQNVQALVGSSVSLFCPVNDDPVPDVRWFKDDTPIKHDQDNKRIDIRKEGCIQWLHIRDISFSDAGTYALFSTTNNKREVLCVNSLEVQDSPASSNGYQPREEPLPTLVITEPEIFTGIGKDQSQSRINEVVAINDNPNKHGVDILKQYGRTRTDGDGMEMTKDTARGENSSPETSLISVEAVNGSNDDILNSVLSTYGTRVSVGNNGDDNLVVLDKDGLTFKDSNSPESYAPTEVGPTDDDLHLNNKVQSGPVLSDADSPGETRCHKSSKRRSSRRSHLRSPTKSNHSVSVVNRDISETIDIDDVNGLPKGKSSRKKRSSSRRKKSPILSKNGERVRLDLEKAEELTEKVDSCLEIIDDLLTLTSYDENENETEEKLRQKLDTLVHKFEDGFESDAISLSSKGSTPSHRRTEPLRTVDLLHVSDSNGEYLDGSDVNLKVSRIQSENNVWGQCSLEDSLKVMSDLVGNISVTVRDKELETNDADRTKSKEHASKYEEENFNNNNSLRRKGQANKGYPDGNNFKRTPLRELLQHSLFSQELTTARVRRRPLPVTRSLDSVDDVTFPCGSPDGKRRHSFGSLYAPRTIRPSRHPFLRTLSMRRRNQTLSSESSSSDDGSPDRFRSANNIHGQTSQYTGHASDDCPAHAGSTDFLPVEQEDKFQQFPDGDTLSSPVEFLDSDCSMDDHNQLDSRLKTQIADDIVFVSHTQCIS